MDLKLHLVSSSFILSFGHKLSIANSNTVCLHYEVVHSICMCNLNSRVSDA